MTGRQRTMLFVGLAIPIAAAFVLAVFTRYQPPEYPNSPIARARIDATIASIRAQPPQANDFDTDPGYSVTDGTVTDIFTLPGNKVKGSIYPHRRSYERALENGKVLARFRFDKKYRGVQGNAWHFWVVVDTSHAGDGKLASLFIPEDPANTQHVLDYLSLKLHDHQHRRGWAKWAKGSDGVGWASCTMYGCCCGDRKCEGRD